MKLENCRNATFSNGLFKIVNKWNMHITLRKHSIHTKPKGRWKRAWLYKMISFKLDTTNNKQNENLRVTALKGSEAKHSIYCLNENIQHGGQIYGRRKTNQNDMSSTILLAYEALMVRLIHQYGLLNNDLNNILKQRATRLYIVSDIILRCIFVAWKFSSYSNIINMEYLNIY